MRKLIVLSSIGVATAVGGALAVTIAAAPSSADSSGGSCGTLSGSGPLPGCSYQVTDDDLSVHFRSAGATRSTLTCVLSESGVVGSVSLSAGESGTVRVRSLSTGIHRYNVRCSTLRGGSGGVSRSGSFTVSVRPKEIGPSATMPTRRPPLLRQTPQRQSPSTRTTPQTDDHPPTAPTTTTTTTTTSTAAAE